MLLTLLPAASIQAATGIRIYNYMTKKETTYTGKRVNVSYQSKKVSEDKTPGLILDGVAYVPYHDIFVKSSMDADYSYNKTKGTLTLAKNNKTIVMTLNSKKATVNGKAVTMSAAPMKLKYVDVNETNILVPAKFVTETLGFGYSWSSDGSTILIKKKTLGLSYNGGTPFEYSGTQGKVTIDGKAVSLGDMPSIIVNNTTMVRAKSIFADSAIDADYVYDSTKKTVTLTKGSIVLKMSMGSSNAYVNGVRKTLSTPPMVVKNIDTGKSYVMVPGSFTASSLGYNYTWNKESSTSVITTGKSTPTPAPTPLEQTPYGNTAGNIYNDGLVAYRNGWLYTYAQSDEGLIRSRLDGSQKTSLNIYYANNINVTNDAIYYLHTLGDNSGKLYRTDLNGKNSKLISSSEVMRSFIIYENYIYYINFNDNDRIYRMKPDGTGKLKLTSDTECTSLSVTEDYVIYNTPRYGMVRMDKDGTDRKLLREHGRNVLPIEDNIYFINTGDRSYIYKMKLDGTGLTKLAENGTLNFNIVGNTIYYSNTDDNNKFYAITTDGKARRKISSEKVRNLSAAGDYLFYLLDSNSSDNVFKKLKNVALKEENNTQDEAGNTAGNILNEAFTAYDGTNIYQTSWELYRMSEDGSNKIKYDAYYLHEEVFNGIHGVNVVGDYVYYTWSSFPFPMSNGIFKVRKDGSAEPELLSTRQAYFMTVVGNWIYYTEEQMDNRTYDGSGPIYKMRIDGTGRTLINAQAGYGRALNIVGDQIYYLNDSDGGSIYRMKTDGTGIERLSEDGGIYNMLVYENFIYYSGYNSNIKRIPIEGGSGTVIVPKGGHRMILEQGKLYYTDYDKIYSCNLDGTEVNFVTKTEVSSNLNITAGYLYYNSAEGSGSLTRLKLE
jgi:hypothetical protein